jgi:hypothetical protein
MAGFVTKIFLGDCTRKGEHIFFDIWLGIVLFYATIVYLNTSTNKKHTVTSNVNNVLYDMVLYRRAWSPSSDLAWSPSFHRYGAKSMARRCEATGSITQLTILTISHQTPHCKTKLDTSTLSLHILRGSRTFVQEPFLTYEHETTTLIIILFL